MTNKDAIFVCQLTLDAEQDKRLYVLSEHIRYDDWQVDGPRYTNHVAVSAVNNDWCGIETYIFPADEEGEILSYSELDGSFKGDMDHAKALSGLGFKIVQGAQ